jgi:hypothetical protein
MAPFYAFLTGKKPDRSVGSGTGFYSMVRFRAAAGGRAGVMPCPPGQSGHAFQEIKERDEHGNS